MKKSKRSRQGRADKNKFRQSTEWKEFRMMMIENRDFTCECCKRKLPSRSLQCHHLKPEEYENLDKNNFAILCHRCHKEVELISTRKDLSALRKEYVNCYKPWVTGEHYYGDEVDGDEVNGEEKNT